MRRPRRRHPQWPRSRRSQPRCSQRRSRPQHHSRPGGPLAGVTVASLQCGRIPTHTSALLTRTASGGSRRQRPQRQRLQRLGGGPLAGVPVASLQSGRMPTHTGALFDRTASGCSRAPTKRDLESTSVSSSAAGFVARRRGRIGSRLTLWSLTCKLLNSWLYRTSYLQAGARVGRRGADLRLINKGLRHNSQVGARESQRSKFRTVEPSTAIHGTCGRAS